jgi:hypothetical protein
VDERDGGKAESGHLTREHTYRLVKDAIEEAPVRRPCRQTSVTPLERFQHVTRKDFLFLFWFLALPLYRFPPIYNAKGELLLFTSKCHADEAHNATSDNIILDQH